MMRTTASSITCPARPPAGTPDEFVNGVPIGAGSACPASSFPPRPPEDGFAASLSITPPCFSFSNNSPASGAEHQRMAAKHFRRSDFRLSNSARKPQDPLFAGSPRSPDPGQIRNRAFAQAGPSGRRSIPAETRVRSPQARVGPHLPKPGRYGAPVIGYWPREAGL